MQRRECVGLVAKSFDEEDGISILTMMILISGVILHLRQSNPTPPDNPPRGHTSPTAPRR
jgi:hypothetical protein